MQHYCELNDVENLPALVKCAQMFQSNPLSHTQFGFGRTIGLVFLNPSLRTRLSSQKAAYNLGMQCLLMNVDGESWGMATEVGEVMDGKAGEHVREAAGVLGRYCDIIGLRAFPQLQSADEDYQDQLLSAFREFSGKPVISLESGCGHPLQALADMITIEQYKPKPKPKIVLSWAPHPKALPQSVANSFSQYTLAMDYQLTISCPEGYELASQFTVGAQYCYNREEALQDADFVYVKNWSSYQDYGKVLCQDESWQLRQRDLAATNQAKIMHCLPVRRNVVIADSVLDSSHAIVIDQAANRVPAAQAVMFELLKHVGSPL